MKKTFKKIAVLLLVAVMLTAVLAPAMAVALVAPVATIDTTKTGSITLYKYVLDASDNTPANGLNEGTLDDRTALMGIEFTIYQVDTGTAFFADVDENGNYTGAYTPDAADIAGTVTTDASGFATLSGLPVGLYYVVEESNPAVRKPVEPFFVSIPITHPINLNEWVYDVCIYPKNEIESGPEIGKDVTQLDNNDDGAFVGKEVTWLITPEVPYGIAAALEYKVTDTFDSVLDYVAGSVVVTAGTVTLEAGTDYTATYYADAAAGIPARTLVIDFTSAGMVKIADSISFEGLAEGVLPYITIELKTTLNEGALERMGEAIENQATLDYTNSMGVSYDSESDEPEVHTGGIVLLKVDEDNNPLKGVKFVIYDNAADANADVRANALYAYNTQTPTESDENYVNVFESDEYGIVYISGLKYGGLGDGAAEGSTKYWVVEIETLAGYNLLTAPLEVTVSAASHLDSNEIEIINRQGIVLPITGGIGTTIFTIAGVALLLIAGVLLVVKKTRKSKA